VVRLQNPVTRVIKIILMLLTGYKEICVPDVGQTFQLVSGIRIDALRITDCVGHGICLARGSLHGARSFITEEGRAALDGLIRLGL
jgi:hypothetical protein